MKLIILDGNSVINRAFYGIRPLSTRDGLFTNGIQGFLNILHKVVTAEKPQALCVAFDLHGPTFRHEKYEGYKATRHGMPEELAMQMPVMKQVLAAMNIPIYECQGWEADDIIGTVSKRCSQAGWDCLILTGDRDSLQLVDEHVTVKLVRSQGGQTLETDYTPALFREEYGFAPIRLIDLKALMGDSSDNIPGVAGVGPKTAGSLLQSYGSLEGVYANLSPQNMKGKLYDKLVQGREMAFLSYELATIRCDAPIDFQPGDALVQPPKRRELYDLLIRLEFRRLIDRYGLQGAGKEAPEGPCRSVGCRAEQVSDPARARSLLEGFGTVAVAVEEDLSAFACQAGEQVYVFDRALLGQEYPRLLEDFFSGPQPKLGHDTKPLLRRLLALGIQAPDFAFDTAAAAYLLDASRGSYGLEALCLQYLQAAPEDGSLAARAAAIGALREPLTRALDEQGIGELYEKTELPLCRVLARMEHAGVQVDRSALQAFGQGLQVDIQRLEEVIYAAAGEEINIHSPRQLGQLLFEKLQLPPAKKTKSGYSTSAEVLESLADRHPVVPAILDYRMLSKLKSTYADGLEREIAPDGRIHTTFQNLVTATGRLSSTEPNLQNIPVRTELGSQIRKMFVPREGWVFVDADYSQIELRVLAHLADDKAMQAAFRSGEDFHSVTASQVFGVELEQVTPLMRRHAKAVNFGIVYGISEFSLAKDIGVSRQEAKRYIDSYKAKYAGVGRYMAQIVEQARQQGWVQTLFGRRRSLPEIKSSNFNVRSGAERIALNTPVQGTAADIIKLAMVRVDRALEEQGLQARLILQVHDELIVECPAFEALRVTEIVAQQMEQAVALSVPLVAEAKIGESWYAAK